MEYVKGKPYFVRDGSDMTYPYLCRDIACDTLIIGGGINGAIANHYLSQTRDVVLVERSRIGYGCTSCATALLEYQLDDFASVLSSTMSDDDIVACYRLGLHAIDEIERFIHTHGNHCHFYRRPTLIYSQDDKYATDLRDECAFRTQHGFQCEYIDRAHNPFYFDIECGLYCERGGAEVDPYLFTQQLIQCSANQSHIYENTEISNISRTDDGYVCTTRYGNVITCRNVVLATGFDFEHIDTDLCTRYISYSIVTQPLPELMWYRRTLLQDCLDPYHYMRTLPDGRIIFGGEDTPMSDTIDAKKADKQYTKLLSQLQALFPDTDIVAEYKFAVHSALQTTIWASSGATTTACITSSVVARMASSTPCAVCTLYNTCWTVSPTNTLTSSLLRENNTSITQKMRLSILQNHFSSAIFPL